MDTTGDARTMPLKYGLNRQLDAVRVCQIALHEISGRSARLTFGRLLVEPYDAIVGEKTLTSGAPRYPELPVTRTSGCCVAMQTPSRFKNMQIHHRNIAVAGDGLRASCQAGSAGLDSSAADPGRTLAQVGDEAWEGRPGSGNGSGGSGIGFM